MAKKAILRSGTVTRRNQTPANLETSWLAADHGLTALAGALDHPDPEMRARAIVLVAEFADKRLGPLLRAMIHDPSPAVRSVAVSAAGRRGSLDLVASLIVALGDPDAYVRRAAAEAVSQATGRPSAPSLMDVVDVEQIEGLKQWWRDQRYAELARGVKS